MKNRLIFVFLTFLIGIGIISVRLFSLQLLGDSRLEKLSQSQFSRNIRIGSNRGFIYDREGEELAISIESFSIYAHPFLIKNKRQVSSFLAKTLGLNAQELYKKLHSKKPFVWITRQVPKEIAVKIKQKKWLGVDTFPEPRRRYPNNSLAAQVLGFVGIDGQGLLGLELAYDRFLKGPERYFRGLTDAFGRPVTSTYRSLFEEEEASAILTIDKSLQYLAEREIESVVNHYEAKNGIVIIMDPKTGEVLALAQYPSFNPNYYYRSSKDVWRNRAITDVFEPGSTFKTFLLAAALDEKVIKANEKFYCENGSLAVLNRTIGEAKNHKWKWLTASDILKLSSNIGAAKIAFKLGRERFYNKIRDFGFGEKTGLHFFGESPGIVRPLKNWSKLDLAVSAFGQGISVSPLQLVTAFSAIANDGFLMQPYLVKEIIKRSGESLFTAVPVSKRRVLSHETAMELKKLLVRVTSKDGTAYAAATPYFEVAGKTGTAQKPNPNGRGYSDQYVSSFIGFFPADNPLYTILVVVDEPKKAYYSSQVAVPAFAKMMQSMVRLYAHRFQDYVAIAAPQPVPEPFGQEKISEEEKTISWNVSEDKKTLVIPNFNGMSMREVLKAVNDIPLTLKVEGTGKVVAQSPSPGTTVPFDSQFKIVFKPSI